MRIFLANVHNRLSMICLAAGKGVKSVLLIPREPIHAIMHKDIIADKRITQSIVTLEGR
jgi:hypothetical protein